MKAITFLGLGKYEETVYQYREQQVRTRFFPLALPQFFPQLQQVLVFVTPKVRASENYPVLQEGLGKLMFAVNIPDGNTEAELWEIFDALIGTVQPGDELVFDITHSFRSLPFLTFLVAAYLRVARGVQVKHVLYGAFQAKDEKSAVTPVFDLSPFVTLLDWITATQQLLQTGNAQQIADFLVQFGRENRQAIFKDTGESLKALTAQLMLCHPLEVMETADKLSNRLSGVEEKSPPPLKPFYLMLDTIKEEYASRAQRDPCIYVPQSLRIQFDLIKWYSEKGLTMQALTLAREWVVSGLGWKIYQSFVLDRARRDKVEIGLSGLARILQEDNNHSRQNYNEVKEFLRSNYPNSNQLARAYNVLIQLRNDVNHAGMSMSSPTAQRIAQRFREEILPALEEFNQWVMRI